MASSDSPVTLIVKTPNQKIKDVSIECGLNWSVNRLKQHLSQTYPGRPTITEQKLIYSGRLLTGLEILKDILKHTYDEGQITHTVHLLCSSSFQTPSDSQQPSTPQSTPVPTNNTSPNQSSSGEGLRHRHPPHTTHTDTHTSQNQPYAQYYGAAPGVQHTGTAAVTTMPAMLPGMPYSPEQMMYFQQIYAQQMAQYMQYMQQYPDAQLGAAVTSAADTGVHGHHAPAAAAAPANGNGAGAANNQQMVMNAAGGQAMFDDDEEANRDWLDVSYMMCRFGVLLMIVYFYSSLSRFLMVFGFFMLIWMYQAGYFRLSRRNMGRQENEVPQQENAPEPQEVNNDNREGEDTPLGDEDPETPEAAPENAEDSTDNAEQEPPHPGVLRVALSFFLTFFTSLIPAQPDAVNAN